MKRNESAQRVPRGSRSTTRPTDRNPTLRDFLQQTLAEYASNDAAPATMAKTRQVFRELIGQKVKTVADLNPAAIARWKLAYPDRRNTTKNSLMRHLTAALTWGVDAGILAENPMPKGKRRGRTKLGRTFLPEEKRLSYHHPFADLCQVMGLLQAEAGRGWRQHRLLALFATVLYTGLRKQEALRLHVADLDLDGGVLAIVKRRRLKTPSSEATLPMPEHLVEILRAWLPRTGSICAFPVGPGLDRPWNEGAPGWKPLDCLKAAGERAGAKGVTFQSLRHSCATHLGTRYGLGPIELKFVLRHTNTRTQDWYLHNDLDNVRRKIASVRYDTPEILSLRERVEALRGDATQTGEPRTGGAAG